MTTLFQHNTLASLMSGLYEGTLTIQELLEKGDFGIGTLEGVDGELIVLDGSAYIARGDQTVEKLNGTETTPYAAVTHFEEKEAFELLGQATSEEVLSQITKKFRSKNLFYFIKVSAFFSTIHVRMAPKQEKPYTTPFVEIAQNQPEATRENVKGTLVGFWTPEMFHGVSVSGFHLHFLSEGKDFGGHVLDFKLQDAKINFGEIDQLNQHFPTTNQTFLEQDFDVENLKKAITESE